MHLGHIVPHSTMKGFTRKWGYTQAEPNGVSQMRTFQTVQPFNYLTLPQPTKRVIHFLLSKLIASYIV